MIVRLNFNRLYNGTIIETPSKYDRRPLVGMIYNYGAVGWNLKEINKPEDLVPDVLYAAYLEEELFKDLFFEHKHETLIYFWKPYYEIFVKCIPYETEYGSNRISEKIFTQYRDLYLSGKNDMSLDLFITSMLL